jgi:hypothetical protein
MKFTNLFLITSIASVIVSAPVLAGPSAKFAASWDTDPVAVAASSGCISSACTGIDTAIKTEIEMATLHVGAQKSILVGVSSEIGIYLLTAAKGGKNIDGDFSSSALAEGSVDVTLSLIADNGAICAIAPDSNVTLKSEMRKLIVSGGGTFVDTDDEFWINVAIATESKGAHHFEFLGVECAQGDYKLTATFDLAAIADAAGVDSTAEVVVTLGDRMVTMQEVRAVKGSLVSDDFADGGDGDPALPL